MCQRSRSGLRPGRDHGESVGLRTQDSTLHSSADTVACPLHIGRRALSDAVINATLLPSSGSRAGGTEEQINGQCWSGDQALCRRVRGSWGQPSGGMGAQERSWRAAGEEFLAESSASAGLEAKQRGRLQGLQSSSRLEHRCHTAGGGEEQSWKGRILSLRL